MDWLAHLITHIPNKGEQLVRYYGYYSNKARGMRKKTDTDTLVPALIDTELSKKAFRKNWSRLIQKIYHTDPLVCPKCSGKMRIISFIEEPDVIKDILLHLNLWVVRNHDPPVDKLVKNIPDRAICFVSTFVEDVEDMEALSTNVSVYHALSSQFATINIQLLRHIPEKGYSYPLLYLLLLIRLI